MQCLIFLSRWEHFDITNHSLTKAEPRNSAMPFPSRKEGGKAKIPTAGRRWKRGKGRGLTFQRRSKTLLEDAGRAGR